MTKIDIFHSWVGTVRAVLVSCWLLLVKCYDIKDPDQVPALELLRRAASSVRTKGTTRKEWPWHRKPSSRSKEESEFKKKTWLFVYQTWSDFTSRLYKYFTFQFQFSSGFMSNSNSRPQSAYSSRPTSRMSLTGSDILDLNRLRRYSPQPASSNLGLARLLNERNIFAGSTISLVITL